MNKYDLIERLNSRFTSLEVALQLLHQQLNDLPLLAARVFSLPEIEKGTEHQPIEQISVTATVGNQAREMGLQHYQRLFIHHQGQNTSSKAALRLPGVLCFSVTDNQLVECQHTIGEINQLKSELERIITIESGLPSEQRFEFVHTHLHGLITLNSYRTITPLLNPSSVRFGWANKHIIKSVTREEILAQLNKSLNAGRAVPPFTREQWVESISMEINDIQRLPEKTKLKIKRPVKVQPIARVWYQEQQKQVQHPCPMPLIAFCQAQSVAELPKLGELTDYDVRHIKHKYKPDAKPLRLLVPRLHLYIEEKR
ncbi:MULTISPECIES: DNA replication terminus site-binding protein [Yersinia]|uniref:DNA replication terminus site-binding protein n=2 Tax=Yersinia bercovieri TaxID=634 RepID=A0A2G4TZS1_YERBE|nr:MULTISPECIES: DNA replication terminus site-binding protein [Yersinia]EEQ05101.1 DNA replication terminus site-binding protein [Yersinia bercovieri ATCC 43970]MCB5300849.1 DNA replication terminus site-binding protein [Yersinia bercovieri]MDN0102018.1 DNA replication terminus site-binding protein [Yersinia bercovieri]PHZ26548.1 DNA replication terminus site-binding protein [Yersinia bercovieri]QDW33438.1 DNA replication terminus site-binding protein [Yersinia sp. KBS0713]